MMSLFRKKAYNMVSAQEALPGRSAYPFQVPKAHDVMGTPIAEATPPGMKELVVAMGCFWGAERKFWQLPGVWTTAVGYAGGYTPHPTYEEVCSGRTGHTEVVRVVWDPKEVSLDQVLSTFWESHDPTQGMRQGNDTGTQYRSAVYVSDPEDMAAVRQSAQAYQDALTEAGKGQITTEIAPLDELFYAEGYHQQYLAKNPNGYCGLGGTGVSCPVGLGA